MLEERKRTAIQMFGDLTDGQEADTGGSKLDRKRQPIEPPDNRLDARPIRQAQSETALECRRAGDEELDRVGVRSSSRERVEIEHQLIRQP